MSGALTDTSILAGTSAQGGFFADNSLRFESGDSPYLSWTPASEGNKKTWTYSFAKPTDSQLASYETAGNTKESNNAVRATRKAAYGDIGDQLDEIYKNIDAWKARIKKIKDDNPKS